MALMQIHFFSNTLGREVAVNTIIPQDAKEYKTLYLLHGLSDDHTAWQRYTRIEQFASNARIAVIMPNCDRSFYTDTAYGDRYFTFLTDELPSVMRGFFAGMTDRREDNFIAGLSMGGYGAFKAALTYPDRYAAACSLSGALDISLLSAQNSIGDSKFFELIFGDLNAFDGSRNDLFALLENFEMNKEMLPSLYMACGTEDFILPCSRRFYEKCALLNIPVEYCEAKGNHNWQFWNAYIEPFVRRIAQESYSKG